MNKKLERWTRGWATNPPCREAGEMLVVSANEEHFCVMLATKRGQWVLRSQDVERGEVLALCQDVVGNKGDPLPPFAFLDLLSDLLPEEEREVLREVLGYGTC